MVFEAKYQRILMLKTKASSILGPLKMSGVIKGNVDGQSLGRPADSWGICSGTCDSGRVCPHQIGFHDIVFSLSRFHTHTHTFLVVRIHGMFAYILCDVFSLAHRARWGISITSNESRFGCMTLIWHDSTLVNACIGGNKMRNFDIGN